MAGACMHWWLWKLNTFAARSSQKLMEGLNYDFYCDSTAEHDEFLNQVRIF